MDMNPENVVCIYLYPIPCTFGGSARKTDIGFPGTVSSATCLSLAWETLSTQISSN